MPSYTLGQAYPRELPALPDTFAELLLDGDDLEILLGMDAPEPGEITAVQTGRVALGLVVGRYSILIPYQIEGFLDGEVSLTVGLSKNILPRDPAEVRDGEGTVLRLVVIDSKSKVVHAERALALSTAMTREIFRAVRAQASGFKLAEHKREVIALDKRFPTAESVMEEAAKRGFTQLFAAPA